jgi:hypothetical protein
MPRFVSRHRVIICLLFLVSLLSPALVPGAGAQSAGSPVLSIASAVALPSTLLTVQGDKFTAGGLVYLAIYDRWGAEVHDHVWAVASTAHFGANGSADPAQGYAAAGTLREVIDLVPATVFGPNGSQDPAQGYVAGFDAPSGAVYGPDGSQDPAQGFAPDSGDAAVDISCGRDLMVRAYDVAAATWSNLLDVTARC